MHRARRGLARWHKALLVLTLAAFLVPVAVPSAHADPWADLKKAQEELDKLQNQKTAVDNAYANTQSEARQTQLTLQKVQAELAIAQNTLAELQARLKQSEEALVKAEAELEQATKEFERRQRLLNTRVRALNEEGPVRYLDVLFGSTSFADFISRMGMLKVIVTRDAELFKSIRLEKQALHERQTMAKARRDELADLRAQAQVRAAEVQAKLAETQQHAATLEQLKRNLLSRMDEMDRQEEALQNLVVDAQRAIARSSGKFSPIWPIRRIELTDTFGMRWHPIIGGYRAHNGIDLSANTGEPILAADDGWVIIAGYNGSFGNLVVVDHGGGVSTWYAHMSRINAWVGQQVKAGHQIGAVGSTGWSTGPHLHFEIRVNGKPVNPMDYLPRR